MWNLNKSCIDAFCTAYNKSVRILLHLPARTHRWLLGPLLGCSHVREQLCYRVACFISKAMCCDNHTVQMIVARACGDARTDLGANAAWLRDNYNLIVPIDSASARSSICEGNPFNAVQASTVQVCRELIDVCAGNQDNGLSSMENSALLATLCIN